MNIGYKWIKGEDGKYYIIELYYNESLTQEDPCTFFSLFGIQPFKDAYCTELSVIKCIYEEETGNQVSEVSGKAYFRYTYKVGQRIFKEHIYFYKHKERAIEEINFQRLQTP